MANQIKAPINYPIIAGGKIVSGGSVIFGQPNVKPDPDNPSTLKAVYLDAALTQQAENPQGISSDGVFDQSDTGILYGPENTVYSIVILGANKKQLSYIPEYDLSDANAASTAQAAAAQAESAASNAIAAKDLTEALYTDFVNRYFGAYSSDPSVDPEGNPPSEGSIYFNTTSNVFFTWHSGAWNNDFPSNPNGLMVTATGTTTPRSLADRAASVINVKDFGAICDGVADDTIPTQNAINYMKSVGGGSVVVDGRVRTTSTIILNGGGVTLSGTMPESIFSASISVNKGGVIYSDFADGPALLISDGGVNVDNLTILGSPTRRSSPISNGSQNSNSAIIIEPADIPSDILQNVVLTNVHLVTHPADGILIEADVANVQINNCYENDLGRHGIAISTGEIGGRTNVSLPGIITIKHGKQFDCGGHGIAIGTPTSVQFPYRIRVINVEGYRLATDAAQRFDTSSNWVVCQDSEFDNCAFGGTTTGNIPDHSGLTIGGRDITVRGCRYISSAGPDYVKVIQQAGFSTENIKFDGGIANTAGFTPPADFATLTAGVDGVHIVRIDHDGANSVDTISVDSTQNDIVLHDITTNKTVHYNHEYDFNGAVVKGINASAVGRNIVNGSIDINKSGYYIVDTEGMAASDDLTDITGGEAGWVIFIRQSNSGRAITVKRSGNIRLDGGVDVTFSVSSNQYLQLMFNGTNWYQVSPLVTNG